MAKDIITIDKSKCVGCNNCIRVCPVHIANTAVREGDNNIVTINADDCIHCGSCIKACAHGARDYVDDIENLIRDLKAGKAISIVIAPAIRTNFPNKWKKVISYLKSIGANKVYDTSFGAEITTWAYLKHITETGIEGLVSQPCPAIVNYIERYVPELLEKLSPVHSPMGCTAVYMHNYDGITDDIAFVSPCIAKYDEVNHPLTPSYLKYNVTFKHLGEYFEKHKINLDEFDDVDFDDMGYGLGSIYPRPGGLKENVEAVVPTAWVRQCEGPHKVYQYLESYNDRVKKGLPLPTLVDVLNCESGCNIGTGALVRKEDEIDNVDCIMNSERTHKNDIRSGIHKQVNTLFKFFDKTLKLSDFYRGYKNDFVNLKPISDDEIRDTFKSMNKNSYVEQHYDCSACGYKTCKDMAEAIARGYNTPENCVRFKHKELEKLKEKLSQEGDVLVTAIDEQKNNNARVFNELDTFTSLIKEEITKTIEESNKISTIADETKIVSVNAGIEAARVGANGNGFMVVADEVGKLAEESKKIVEVTNANNNNLIHMIDDIVERTNSLRKEIEESENKIFNLIEERNSDKD